MSERAEAKKSMRDGSATSLDDSLKMAVDNLNQLMVLREEYRDQIKKSGDLKEFAAGAEMSINDIDDLVSRCQSLLNDSMFLLKDIIERYKQDRNEFIIRLGMQEVMKRNDANKDAAPEKKYTHQQIVQMGWERFKEIGEEKRRNGLPLSNLSLEKQFMESLLDYYLPKIRKVEPKIVSFASNQVAATIILPESVRQVFQMLDTIEGKHYLTGSTLFKLIKKCYSLAPLSVVDLDFTTTCSNAGKVFDANNKFSNSKHVRRLYQLNDKGMKVDLYLSESENMYSSDADWMHADVEARNFTISSLLCDRYGHVYDVTGRGLIDIKDNVLSTIGSANKLLEKDPSTIFSAFKKMVEGCSPDQNLKDALRHWQPKPDFDKSHVYAVVRKHLKTLPKEDALKYVSFIFQYNMQEKVFGSRSVESTGNLLERIKSVVNPEAKLYAPTLFADTSRVTNASMGSDSKREFTFPFKQ